MHTSVKKMKINFHVILYKFLSPFQQVIILFYVHLLNSSLKYVKLI